MRKLHAIRKYLIPKTPKIGSKGLKEREEGISALVPIRNEPWIEPSILSIQNLVDEVVVVDSSTEEVSKRVERIIKKLRKEGIFIAYGPDIKNKGEIDKISILDLAPTILASQGIKKLKEMDGKNLEILENP